MERGLDVGRRKGYAGWDMHWHDVTWDIPPGGVDGYLMQRLMGEILELAAAISAEDIEAIRREAADVANMAMMVADYELS